MRANRRRTRLDQGYLCRLANGLARSAALRRCLILRPNSSLYRAGGRIRYMEYSVDDQGIRDYKLVAVEESPHLLAALEWVRHGTSMEELSRALAADGEAPLHEAEEFVLELIDAQILTLDLEPRITGPDPVAELIRLLDCCAETSGLAQAVRTVCDDIRELDRTGIGREPAAYRAMAARLESLPARIDPSRLWHVDLFGPSAQFALGQEVARAIEECTALARQITPAPPADLLSDFRDAFRRRHGEKWMPLMEVLDPESGIGFPVGASAASDASLLAGFGFGQRPEKIESGWTAREIFIFRRLQTLLSCGQREWELSEDDMRGLDEGGASRPIPDSVAMVFALAATSEDAVERGEYRLRFDGCFGHSGVRLLGRFCYGDDELNERSKAHLRKEEAYRPDALFAELVHRPQGRSGNMLARPVLRGHEIPFLGRSGADPAQQIALSDLVVSVVDDRVVLYSRARQGK